MIAGWIAEREKQLKAAKKSRDTWGPPVTEFRTLLRAFRQIADIFTGKLPE